MIFSRQEKFASVLKGHSISEDKPMANDVPPFDLKQEILKLKKDFDQKFDKDEKSGSSDSLKNFKFMAILGQGAFGVVVTFPFSYQYFF